MWDEPPQVEVLFHGPKHRLEAFGQIVRRGESAMFTEAEVFALQAEDRIVIELLVPPPGAADTTNASADTDVAEEPEASASGEGRDKTHETKERE